MARKKRLPDAVIASFIMNKHTLLKLKEIAHLSGVSTSEKLRTLIEPLIDTVYRQETGLLERRAEMAEPREIFAPDDRHLKTVAKVRV